jgi:nucleoside-diphosphate-sugar epimerase
MKILIIGGGYVGSAIAQKWQKDGHFITITTTTPHRIPELQAIANQAIVLKGDDLPQLKTIVKDQEVIVLMVSPRGGRELINYQQTYLETAHNVVTAVKNSPTVKQIIYTSSFGIIGDQNGDWIDETITIKPSNERNQILAQTEQVLLALNHQPNFDNILKVCILRLAGIYGTNRELLKIFQSWAGTTRATDGEEYSNWIHLDDIVNALELIRLRQLQGIYHLGNDQPLPKKVLLEQLCQKHGLQPIHWTSPSASPYPHNLRLSNHKIKAEGLHLKYPETLL